MLKMKKIVCLLLGAAVLLAGAASAHAAEAGQQYPAAVDPGVTGNVTVRYMDGADGTSPVTGAVFTLYRIADYTQRAAGGRVAAYCEPLIGGITVDADTDPAGILGAVQGAYAAGKVDGGNIYTMETGEDGNADAAGVAQGAYLAAETLPADGYAASIPFIFTVPQMVYADDGTACGWNYDITAYPKALPLPTPTPRAVTPSPTVLTPTPADRTRKPSVTGKPESKEKTVRAGRAKTGDNSRPVFYAGIALCAAAVIFIVLKNRRDDGEDA